MPFLTFSRLAAIKSGTNHATAHRMHTTADTRHRVVLVDDQLLSRAGVGALLTEMDGFQLVGWADHVAAALDLIERERPDVVLLDLNLRGEGDGLEVLARLPASPRRPAVLVLSASHDARRAAQALRQGAQGYVCKDFVLDELAFALRCAVDGRRYVSAAVSVEDAAPVALSGRQAEVLQGIARGLSNKGLARALGISVKTVAYHRAELMAKLDLHDVAGLTRYALASGLLSPGLQA